MTKKKKGKKRTLQNLYRPKRHVPKKPTQMIREVETEARIRSLIKFSLHGKNLANSGEDYVSLISLPKRYSTLNELPDGIRDQLRKHRSISISKILVKLCLGEKRFELMKKTDKLGNFLGRLHIFLLTSKLSSESVYENQAKVADGYIRDQYEHPLCWDYTLCNLISATTVLCGQMKHCETLSQIYVCQNVSKQSYKKRSARDPLTNQTQFHSCYPYSIYSGLEFVKKSKCIPKANEMEMKIHFD
ncbi:unnamed protein product [Arabidopsis halleri]